MIKPIDNNKHKVLVTGASGFVGRRIVDLLVRHGYSVRAFVRKTSRTEHLDDDAIEVFVGDVSDISTLESAFEGAAYVVHAAADTIGSDEAGRNVTIGGTNNVVSLCRQFNIKKLVYISSCSVYQVAGMKADKLINEGSALESSPSSRGPYTWAKLEAEGLVADLMAESKTPVVCLRPGAIYGPDGKPFSNNIGYSFKNRFFIVIGMGKMTIPLVHVENVAESVLRSIEDPRADGQTFNVVDPDRVTKKHYNNLLIRQLYPKAAIIYVPYSLIYMAVATQELLFRLIKKRPFLTRYRLASSQTSVIFDGSRIMRELEWDPLINFEAAVKGFQVVADQETKA